MLCGVGSHRPYLRGLTGDVELPEGTESVTLWTHDDLASDVGVTHFLAEERRERMSICEVTCFQAAPCRTRAACGERINCISRETRPRGGLCQHAAKNLITPHSGRRAVHISHHRSRGACLPTAGNGQCPTAQRVREQPPWREYVSHSKGPAGAW